MKVDIVNEIDAAQTDAFHTITIGGQSVVQTVPAGFFRWNNFRGQQPRIIGNFGENQSYQVVTINGSTAGFQPNFIEYYANPFDTPEMREKLNNLALNTKQIHFAYNAAAGLNRTETYIAPKNRGKIFALQVFVDGAGLPSLSAPALITVQVNGTSVVETVTALNFRGDSSRQCLFPIDIEPGSTFNLTINNAANANAVFAGIALYFEPGRN